MRCGSFQIPQYQLEGKEGFLCVTCHWAAAIISTTRTSAVSYFNSSYYKLVSYCCSSQRSEDCLVCQQGNRESTGPFVKGGNKEEAKGGHTKHLILSLMLEIREGQCPENPEKQSPSLFFLLLADMFFLYITK